MGCRRQVIEDRDGGGCCGGERERKRRAYWWQVGCEGVRGKIERRWERKPCRIDGGARIEIGKGSRSVDVGSRVCGMVV